jgi:hypothetical protein
LRAGRPEFAGLLSRAERKDGGDHGLAGACPGAHVDGGPCMIWNLAFTPPGGSSHPVPADELSRAGPNDPAPVESPAVAAVSQWKIDYRHADPLETDQVTPRPNSDRCRKSPAGTACQRCCSGFAGPAIQPVDTCPAFSIVQTGTRAGMSAARLSRRSAGMPVAALRITTDRAGLVDMRPADIVLVRSWPPLRGPQRNLMLWSMASNSAKNADASEAPLFVLAQASSVLPLTSMTAIRIAASGWGP